MITVHRGNPGSGGGPIRDKAIAETVHDQATEWQPIESAPKDGTMILLWRPDWPCPIFASWSRRGRRWRATAMGPLDKPTNWMAAPEPPDGHG